MISISNWHSNGILEDFSGNHSEKEALLTEKKKKKIKIPIIVVFQGCTLYVYSVGDIMQGNWLSYQYFQLPSSFNSDCFTGLGKFTKVETGG